MPPKRSTVDKALSSVLSDTEDLDLSDYSNGTDFELETEHSSGESDGSDHDTPVVGHVLPEGPPQPRRGRRRGAGILRTQHFDIPLRWGTNIGGVVTQQFTAHRATGPDDIPANINAERSPLDFLSLFADDALWDLLVTETNRQAFNVKSDKPNCYIAKPWTDTTVREMKAFFGCRIARSRCWSTKIFTNNFGDANIIFYYYSWITKRHYAQWPN